MGTDPLLVAPGRETLLGEHGSGPTGEQLAAGAFGTGSVQPEVEARRRANEQRGARAAIAALEHLLDAPGGETGIQVQHEAPG